MFLFIKSLTFTSNWKGELFWDCLSETLTYRNNFWHLDISNNLEGELRQGKIQVDEIVQIASEREWVWIPNHVKTGMLWDSIYHLKCHDLYIAECLIADYDS